MIAWLATINGLILVFNLLPGLPDGRRPDRPRDRLVARPATAITATRIAANLGRFFGYLFIAGGSGAGRRGATSSAAIWLALIGMVVNGAARGAAMQTALDRPDRRRPRRRRDGPRAGRDPRRPLGRAGARRVLPPLPLALVPGRRRRPPLPRPRSSATPPTRSPRSPAPAHFVSEIVDSDRGLFIRDDTPLDSLLSNQNLRRFGALMAVDADGRLERRDHRRATRPRPEGRHGCVISVELFLMSVRRMKGTAQATARWRSMMRA